MRYWYLPDAVEPGVHETPGPPPPAYRVITPARTLRPEEVRRLPDLMKLKFDHDDEQIRTLDYPGTYAMAEEIATATLIESVALRFELPGGMRGVAIWWDWRWHGAIVRELGVLTRERLELLITTGSAEVPTFGCERCGREGLKQNKDKSLRAHKRLNWHPPYREECR